MSSSEFETDSNGSSNAPEEIDEMTKMLYLCGPVIYQFCQETNILAEYIPAEILETLASIPLSASTGEITISGPNIKYNISLISDNVLYQHFNFENSPAKVQIYDAIFMLVQVVLKLVPKISSRSMIFEKETMTLFSDYNSFRRLAIKIEEVSFNQN